MGVSYIPQNKVFAVCTFQLSTSPQKFSYSRGKVSVYYQNNEQPLLTVNDKNIMEQFTCKSPWNIAGSLLAFGAGLIVGALLLSNPIGWVVLGVAVVGAGAIMTIKAVTHKCTDPLKGGNWFLAHNSVKINGASAITRSSILKCGSGGVLTPFFDEASAKAAASSIANKNRWELGINVVASFGAGFFLPSAFTGFGAASVAGKIWMAGGRFVAGFAVFSGINYTFKGGIRTYHENVGDMKDNVTYDQMNNHTERILDGKGGIKEENIDQNSLFGMPSKPDDLTQDSEDIVKVQKNGNNKYDVSILSKVTGIVESYSVHADNKALQQKLENLDGLSRQQLKTNPIAQGLLNDLNNGKYPEWRSTSTHYNSGRMNPSMVDDGKAAVAEKISKSLKAFKDNSIQGFLFLIPFVGTWFSEQARAALAEGVANDMAAEPNGSSVVANTPVD